MRKVIYRPGTWYPLVDYSGYVTPVPQSIHPTSTKHTLAKVPTNIVQPTIIVSATLKGLRRAHNSNSNHSNKITTPNPSTSIKGSTSTSTYTNTNPIRSHDYGHADNEYTPPRAQPQASPLPPPTPCPAVRARARSAFGVLPCARNVLPSRVVSCRIVSCRLGGVRAAVGLCSPPASCALVLFTSLFRTLVAMRCGVLCCGLVQRFFGSFGSFGSFWKFSRVSRF